jgi:hypothetical protein
MMLSINLVFVGISHDACSHSNLGGYDNSDTDTLPARQTTRLRCWHARASVWIATSFRLRPCMHKHTNTWWSLQLHTLRSGTDSKNLCIGRHHHNDKFFEEYCLLPIFNDSFHHIGYPRYYRDILYIYFYDRRKQKCKKCTQNIYIKTRKIEEKCTQKIFLIKHIKNAKKTTQKIQNMQKMHTEIANITQKLPKMIYRG